MYFVIDSFSASSTSSSNNSSGVVDADPAHLHRHYELPGNIILPSWLPLDPRVRFLLVSIAAPFLISSIGLLGVGTKLGFWWFICFLTVLFLLAMGAALLSGHYAVESFEIIKYSTRVVSLCVGLPLFLALLGVVLIHFWRARRRQYLQQQSFMHDVKTEIALRQAATMKIASIVDREQLSLNALATQLARQRKRNWRIHHFQWLEVCLQGIFVLVCLIGVLVAWGIIPLHDSLQLLQHTIVFRVIGALCLVVLILCLIWLVLYFSFTGRTIMHYVRNYMSHNIISIIMFGLSFLYTTMVVNFVTVLYCKSMTCTLGTLPHDTASVFPIANYVNINNNHQYINTDSANYARSKEEGNCIAIDVYEYNQSCSSIWQFNISHHERHSNRLVYDNDVACGKTTGLFRAGAALIFASYICLLPWYQYVIARYTVHILKDEYPLERRFIDAFSQEELYYQRISSSKNPGQAVFRAYKPEFRYYSFSFMLQKIILAVVSCTTRKGMSEHLKWIPYVCFTLVPCAAAIASCYFRPFARPTERMYFPTIQGMVSLVSLYGLIGYLSGPSHIPLFVGIILAIMTIFIPLLMLVWGTICSLYAEREEIVKLRERLRVRFAQSLVERHVIHTNQKTNSKHNIDGKMNNKKLSIVEEEELLSETENRKREIHENAEPTQNTSHLTEMCNYNCEYVPNNAFTEINTSPPLSLWIEIKQKVKQYQKKVTHVLRIIFNAPELFHHSHRVDNNSNSVNEHSNDNTDTDGAETRRRWSVLDRIRRMSFIALDDWNEEEEEECETSSKTNAKQTSQSSHHKLFINNLIGKCKNIVKTSPERTKEPQASAQHSVPPEPIVVQLDYEINTEYSYNAFHFEPSLYFMLSCYPFMITSSSHFHGRRTNRWLCVNEPPLESENQEKEQEEEEEEIGDSDNASMSSWNTTRDESENVSIDNDNEENTSKVSSSRWSSATLRISSSSRLHESTYTFPIEHRTSWVSSSSNGTLVRETATEEEEETEKEGEEINMKIIVRKCLLYIKKMYEIINHKLHRAIHFCDMAIRRVWHGFIQRSEHIIELIKQELFIDSNTKSYHHIGTRAILTFADVYTWRRNAVRRLRELEHLNQNASITSRQYKDKDYPRVIHPNNSNKNNTNNRTIREYEHPYWYDNARILVEEMHKAANMHVNRNDCAHKTENYNKERKEEEKKEEQHEEEHKEAKEQEWVNLITDEYVEILPHFLKMQAPQTPSLLPHGELSVLCETQTIVGKQHDKLMHFLLLNSNSPTEHFLHKETELHKEHKLESELCNKEQISRTSVAEEEDEEKQASVWESEKVHIIDFDFDEHVLNSKKEPKSKEIKNTKRENIQSTIDECVMAAENVFVELHQWWDEHNYIFPVYKLQADMESKNNIFQEERKHEKEIWISEYDNKVNRHTNVEQRNSNNPLGIPHHSFREYKHYNHNDDNVIVVTNVNAESSTPAKSKSTVSNLTERNIEQHILNEENNSVDDDDNKNQPANVCCTDSTLENDTISEDTSFASSSWSSACSSFATSTGYYASGVNSYYTSDLMRCLVGVNHQTKETREDKVYKTNKKDKHLEEIKLQGNVVDKPLAVEKKELVSLDRQADLKDNDNYKNKNDGIRGKVHHKYNGNPLTCDLLNTSSSSSCSSSFLFQPSFAKTSAPIEAASATPIITHYANNRETCEDDVPGASSSSSQHTSLRFIPPSKLKSHHFDKDSKNSASRESAVVDNKSRRTMKHSYSDDEEDDDDDEDGNLVELMRELHLRDSNSKETEKTNSLTKRHSFRYSNSRRNVHNLKNELGSSKASLINNKSESKLINGKLEKDKDVMCAVDGILVDSPEDQSVECSEVKSASGSKTRRLSRVLHLHKLLSQSSLSSEELFSTSSSSSSFRDEPSSTAAASSSSVFVSSANNRSKKCTSSLTSLRSATLQPNQEKEKLSSAKKDASSTSTSRSPQEVKIRKTASLYNLAKMKMHNFSNRWRTKRRVSVHADEEMCRQLCKGTDHKGNKVSNWFAKNEKEKTCQKLELNEEKMNSITTKGVSQVDVSNKVNTHQVLEHKKNCSCDEQQQQQTKHNYEEEQEEETPEVNFDVNVFNSFPANVCKYNNSSPKQIPEEYLELEEQKKEQHQRKQEATLSFRNGYKKKKCREEESVLSSSSSSSSFLENVKEEPVKRKKEQKMISMQRLRYHYVLRVELLQSFWDNQAQLRSVQRAIDKKIYHTLRRIIQMYLFLLGSIAAVALALALSGILKKLDSGFFIDGQRYEWTTVSYELAHYPSWDEFTRHCCCVAVTNLSGTEPPFYAMDAENWICENGYTKQRIRRDRLDSYLGIENYHTEEYVEEEDNTSQEEGVLLKSNELEKNTTPSVKNKPVHILHEDTSYVDGYAVRPLCAMNFTHGCELVFSKHNHADVVFVKCNDSSITSAELKR